MGKTNLGLVEYAKAQLGKPYWFGCYGQQASENLYYAKKAQYGDKLSGSEQSYLDQCKKKQKVHDCSGLIKGFMYCETPESAPLYVSKYDLSSSDMIKACKEQGPYSSIPNIPGLLLWKSGHVGVYIGDGYAIEAKGHSYGVVKTNNTAWTKWGKLPWLEYQTATTPTQKEPAQSSVTTCTVSLPVIRKGDKDSKYKSIKKMQLLLNDAGARDENGSQLEVDGSCGAKSVFAIKQYQAAHGLTVDGVCGQSTWQSLLTN